eukprot:1536378-Rhodomonas_salina.1
MPNADVGRETSSRNGLDLAKHRPPLEDNAFFSQHSGTYVSQRFLVSVGIRGIPGYCRSRGTCLVEYLCYPAIRGICTSGLTTSSSRNDVPQGVPRNKGTKTRTAAMWCGVVPTKGPNALGP